MSELNNRIHQIHEHIQNLHNRVTNFTNVATEPDPICRFKRELINGPIAPIGIQSMHQGLSKAVGKIVPKSKRVNINIYMMIHYKQIYLNCPINLPISILKSIESKH